MRFVQYYVAFFPLVFVSIVLSHHVNTQQFRKEIQSRTNAFTTSDESHEALKHKHGFNDDWKINSSYVGSDLGKSDFPDELLLKNTFYNFSPKTLPTLIRKKRFWRIWRKKDPSTTTSTTTTKTTPVPSASEKKDLASWFSRAASKVKEAVKKGASDVKESFKTLGRKIKKHFTKSDDNFHVFVNKVKEQVDQGDKDALDLLSKLGIDVKYDKTGQPIGSIVSRDAGNVTDILINEGYYNPGNLTMYIQPDKAVIVFPSNTVTKQPALVTKKIMSTKLPMHNTTNSVTDAVEKVISVTSLPNMEKSSENIATLFKTEVPTKEESSLITGSIDKLPSYELLASTSTAKVPADKLSSTLELPLFRNPLTSKSTITLVPTIIAREILSTSLIATSTHKSPTYKTITTEASSLTMTTPFTTTTITKTTTLNTKKIIPVATTTTPTITTITTTTSAIPVTTTAISAPLTAPYNTTTTPLTTTTTTPISTTTTPTTFTSPATTTTTLTITTNPPTSTTTSPTTTTTTPTTTTTTPTTTTTTPTTTTSTTTTTTTPITTTTTTPTTTTTTTPTTITPTTTTTTTPTTTTIITPTTATTIIPTTTTTTTPTTTTTTTPTTATTTTPTITTTTPSTTATTKSTTTSTTKRTTNTTKKTTTTEAPFPPPFPDIFKDSAVRDRLHELFLNGDFNHDDLKSSFNFDPAKYDDYEY